MNSEYQTPPPHPDFNIYEQDKFCAQLSWAWKKLYDLGARSISLFNSSYAGKFSMLFHDQLLAF